MNTYFCCTYTHSEKGFFPTYLDETGLVPADGSGAVQLPQDVWDFFSFDKFKVLWREYSQSGGLFPSPCGGMLGIRRIEASFNGRGGLINIAVTAGEDELRELENAAALMLGKYKEFSQMLSGCMSPGGECGYTLNTDRYFSYINASDTIDFKTLDSYAGGKIIAKALRREEGLFSQRDLLRFAVTSEKWKEVRGSLGKTSVWRKKPKCVISQSEFDEKFDTEI